MATLNVRTLPGKGPSTLTDADYSVGKVTKLGATNYGDKMTRSFALTAAVDDVIDAVLGNKSTAIDGSGDDTLIVGGVVPVQISAAFQDSDIGKGIAGSATAGVAAVKATGGKFLITGGGTMKVRNPTTGVESTVNVAYVDLDR